MAYMVMATYTHVETCAHVDLLQLHTDVDSMRERSQEGAAKLQAAVDALKADVEQAHIAVAYIVMAYVLEAYTVMAYIVIAYIVTANIFLWRV